MSGTVVTILRAKHIFKVVFVGDPAVGKTSLVARHVRSSFRENYIPSLGANITSNDYLIDNYAVTLLIWDIAGQEIFSSVREKYYAGAKAAFVVYDITRPETLNGTKIWVDDVKKFVSSDIPLVLVGNKTDLERKVDRRDGEIAARKLNAQFMETSAKTGENVPEVFREVAAALVNKLVKHT
jgi:small GTP-binding protein